MRNMPYIVDETSTVHLKKSYMCVKLYEKEICLPSCEEIYHTFISYLNSSVNQSAYPISFEVSYNVKYVHYIHTQKFYKIVFTQCWNFISKCPFLLFSINHNVSLSLISPYILIFCEKINVNNETLIVIYIIRQ